MKHKLVLCVLAILFISLALAGCSSQPQVEDFRIETLDEYRGKIIVLNFWATWCPPCRAEMPGLEAFYQEYRDQGVVVLAVNVSDSAADIIAFAREYGLTFPILRDSQREGIRTYRVQALPTTFFLDRQGQVRHRQVGAMSKDAFAQLLERLF